MEAREVASAEDLRRLVAERDLKHVKVGVFDVDGILRGKYMAREKLFSSLDGGFGFCDVVLGWDSHDQLYDNVRFTGWHTGYPDAAVRLLPDTCRDLPGEGDGVFVLGEFTGSAEPICPRAVLRRVIERGRSLGYQAWVGFEYEFFVFQETPQSVREKGYRDLTPLAPGFFGYSVLRNSVHAGFYQLLLDTCERMDLRIEGLHEETGPGALEAALHADGPLPAADKAALFKTFSKIVAQRAGLMATFMAKWSPEWPGLGGHIHMSLRDLGGSPVFHDPAASDGMSRLQRQFVAGQQRLMPELLALVAPTVNSFTRLIPGFWAPTDASWGLDNRTCALRVVPGSAKSQRVEYRVAAADANPYLALAAALASGFAGIEQGLEPEPAVVGSAYDRRFPRRLQLPRNLAEAATRLRRSRAARDWLGEPFVEHFAATREWEQRQFNRHISDWELARYFEII
jgi:glutamine synthetase